MPALTLRLPTEVHEAARVAAAATGQSMHSLIVAAVREKMLRLGAQNPIIAAALDRMVKK